MISLQCPACDTNYSVEERLAGATLKCPSCGERVRIPRSPGEAGPGAGAATPGTGAAEPAPAEEGEWHRKWSRRCPHCGSRRAREASRRLSDYVLGLVGLRPYRCGGCGRRYRLFR
jgi:DNA-directed RNA polymerase subunit RPC12/RpoP